MNNITNGFSALYTRIDIASGSLHLAALLLDKRRISKNQK